MKHPPESTGRRRLIFLFAFLGALVVLQAVLLLNQRRRSQAGRMTPERAQELGVAYMPSGRVEIESQYSPIVIEESGTVRSLYFVDNGGWQALESRMDVARPHELLVPYTRTMFASYLFLPRPERVLIVGLGGGSMIRFLQHHDPGLEIDVVEIDPAILDVARDYFGTRASPTVRILERDGFEFLRTAPAVYDVVYMDAFLRPSEETDASGTPLRLKTRAFLEQIKSRVHPGGLVVFNVHELADLELLREVFEQTFVFRLDAPGRVAVGTSLERPVPGEALERVARELDARFRASFSFLEMLERLDPA